MRRCELCKTKARMHCAADQANLCWDCDASVHSANFLVARHSRNLLCGVCQSPASWSASGGKLRPSVFVCEQCIDQEPCDDNSHKELELVDEIVDENQIVPPPPLIESTSSDDESVNRRDTMISKKRFQIEVNQRSRLNIHSSAHTLDLTKTFSKSKKKESKMVESGGVEVYGSAILDSLRRLHQEDMGSEQEIVELLASP